MNAFSLISGMRLQARQVRAGAVTETPLPGQQLIQAARGRVLRSDQSVECWTEGVVVGPHAELHANQPISHNQSFTTSPMLEHSIHVWNERRLRSSLMIGTILLLTNMNLVFSIETREETGMRELLR